MEHGCLLASQSQPDLKYHTQNKLLHGLNRQQRDTIVRKVAGAMIKHSYEGVARKCVRAYKQKIQYDIPYIPMQEYLYTLITLQTWPCLTLYQRVINCRHTQCPAPRLPTAGTTGI